ncbi:MAG TPA: sugar ABC transporter permease [Spirochaetia bacterium]|nr:sugar ABC transporter permease [Spirochaetia bacterium]
MELALRRRVEERRAYWLFVSPAVILYALVLAFPIVVSILLSLSNYNGGLMFGGKPWGIVGFQQYAKLAHDPQFWQAFRNNIYIVLISAFGQVPLGFVFAYLIYRRIVRGGEFWQAILYAPNIISVVVLGLLWKVIINSNGLLEDVFNRLYAHAFMGSLNHVLANGFVMSDDLVRQLLKIADPGALSTFSDPFNNLKEFLAGYSPDQLTVLKSDLTNLLARKWSPQFMARPGIAMLPILFVFLWCWTGLYLIMFLANMQKIDKEVLEAARIDGAGEGQVLGRIVLPGLSGVIANAVILCIAGSLNSFTLIWAMTGGGPMNVTEVLSIYMYRTAVVSVNYPLSNAIAMSIVVFSMVLIVLTRMVERRWGGRE